VAKNEILSARSAQDINEFVDRVHKGLGRPEPPLDLLAVRELLDLDFSYYTKDDPGLMDEAISRIKVGAKRLFREPTLFLSAVKKLDLRAVFIPDGNRILLDKSQPELKHRWTEAHEIGHSLIPWHRDSMMGDIDFTLTPACHDKLETEANYAAGRLLFMGDRFHTECADTEPGFESIKILRKRYRNTLSTTLYRSIEVWGATTPVLGLITDHPHPDRRTEDFDENDPCRHFIQSPAFARRFSKLRQTTVFDQVVTYCNAKLGGPIGEADVVLIDDNGEEQVFWFQTFYNRYSALTLGIHQRANIVLR
jgi:hypothetical protein